MKNIIRSAPGVPAEYMLVRKDYLTELHHSRAQWRSAHLQLYQKYTRVATELLTFQRDRQEEWLKRLADQPTSPRRDIVAAFAELREKYGKYFDEVQP